MKIFSADQIKQADAFTIKNEPIAAIDLMARAVNAFYSAVEIELKKHITIHIFCGLGDNGGDGLMLAEKIAQNSFQETKVYTIKCANRSESNSFLIKRLKENPKVELFEFEDKNVIENINLSSGIIVDALFGIGLSRPVDGLFASLIDKINDTQLRVISIDLPSGMQADTPPNSENKVVKADLTISFQFPKFSFFFPESYLYTGEVKVVPIALHQDFIQNEPTHFHTIDFELVSSIFRKRNPVSHKGNHGRALVIAGSTGRVGAAVLCVKACVKSGAGLSFAFVPKGANTILQSSLPEAMTILSENYDFVDKSLSDFQQFDAIGIGCGIGTEPLPTLCFQNLLENYNKPIVVDADALNIISENNFFLTQLPLLSIITPHPAEFDRLTHKHQNHFERFKTALTFSEEYNLIVVLKNAYTFVILPEGKVYIQPELNAGLAKGGSGDMLTGIITSLLAQGYSSENAAVLGVYLHAQAAKKALTFSSPEALTPSEVIEQLGSVFHFFYK